MRLKLFTAAFFSLSLSNLYAFQDGNSYYCQSIRGNYQVGFISPASGFNVFKGNEQIVSEGHSRMSITQTPMGSLVSAPLKGSSIDGPSFQFAILIPDVNLFRLEKYEINTTMFRITHMNSIGGPNLVDGPLQRVEAIPATCTVTSTR